MRKPPTLTALNLETVAVEAWALWAEPKASLTSLSP